MSDIKTLKSTLKTFLEVIKIVEQYRAIESQNELILNIEQQNQDQDEEIPFQTWQKKLNFTKYFIFLKTF